MPSQLEKLEAYSGALLDAFLKLKEIYEILDLMLFDRTVIANASAGFKARGFNHLLENLYTNCCQQVAKLALDSDKRTPSVQNIVEKLEIDSLRNELRKSYAERRFLSESITSDPEISEALERLALKDQRERWGQFDEHYANLLEQWSALSKSSELSGMALVRDKVSAHTEIKYAADKYEPYSLNHSGLKWDDLKKVIERLKDIVELIGFIVRRAGFAWDIFEENTKHSALEFWGISGQKSTTPGQR